MVTKKEFKELCYSTTYKGYRQRYNAIFYDIKDNGWKYMVFADVKDITKKELLNKFYNWLKDPELYDLPWYIYLRCAQTDEKRFKVPISL